MDIIRDTVLRTLPLPSPEFDAKFHVKWDVDQYVAKELNGLTDIGRVFTITGGSTDAFASSCKDYLGRIWKDLRYDLCSHIQHYLEQGEYGMFVIVL